MSQKKWLRDKIQRQRSELSAEKIESAEAALLKKISHSHFFSNLRTCAVYLHIENEVPTTGLIALLLARGVRVLIPRVTQEQLEFFQYDSAGLVTSAWGIVEPDASRCQRCALSECDTVILPGIAFDRQGGRIGRGAGYYDRALSPVVASPLRPRFVGLAYAFQVVSSCFTEPHDIPVDEVIVAGPAD